MDLDDIRNTLDTAIPISSSSPEPPRLIKGKKRQIVSSSPPVQRTRKRLSAGKAKPRYVSDEEYIDGENDDDDDDEEYEDYDDDEEEEGDDGEEEGDGDEEGGSKEDDRKDDDDDEAVEIDLTEKLEKAEDAESLKLYMNIPAISHAIPLIAILQYRFSQVYDIMSSCDT